MSPPREAELGEGDGRALLGFLLCLVALHHQDSGDQKPEAYENSTAGTRWPSSQHCPSDPTRLESPHWREGACGDVSRSAPDPLLRQHAEGRSLCTHRAPGTVVGSALG